ncbi:glycosyl hydrolase family 92-domain-containing protein [Infundibulicybe gibba]|nr:glycosyl hydrolase family 92-domain-containing protein [Infundibulicybe gibba]
MFSVKYFPLLYYCALTAAKAVPPAFRQPPSDAVDHVNPLIGNGGYSKGGGSGGMIPSTAPPFAMTRWIAQTLENYVSVTPYNYTETAIHGFQGTHQPAIWMGESGPAIVIPGAGQVKTKFEERGMTFSHDDEVVTPSYYSVDLSLPNGGTVFAEQSATSHVGHLRFTFRQTDTPYVILEATRAFVVGSTDTTNTSSPIGTVVIDPAAREISGSNPERQDFIIGPVSTPAKGFSGYFCARFDKPFASWGTSHNGTLRAEEKNATGPVLSGFAQFSPKDTVINVRVGVSFISIDQARKNLDDEIRDGTTLEQTAETTRSAWAEKLDRIKIDGASEDNKHVFYTAFFHAMQYPYEQSEGGRYYSGYDDSVHTGVSYTGYSIWDTYRAEWAWLILFAPERLPGMVTSMLNDFKEGGRLPMWKNIIETNIMVGTHADSLVAEAVLKGITGFDLDTAYAAVIKDATVPPVNDNTTVYSDRQENVDFEARAGLSSVYADRGWVASDIHSEAGSRTLDYGYDDFAVSVLATALNKTADAAFFHNRSIESPFSIFNPDTNFMEARNADGSFAGPDAGWTEGDKWTYTFDVVHNILGLAQKRGGNASFVQSLEDHFNGGHNDHRNEPSHHIPYLYSMVGAATKTQERVREIAQANYNASINGLSGNEDCGQTSAWFLFSALGFYPVNPVSGEYVVGTPFFDRAEVNFPGAKQPLIITSQGAATSPYVKSLNINGQAVQEPVINTNRSQVGVILHL